MKFAIIGGDLRTIKLVEMLAKDENDIYIYGLEKAEELKNKSNIITCDTIKKTVEDAEIVIGPIPFSSNGNTINSPFGDKEITIRETDNEEIEKVTADDLLLIVNSLKQAGAEAISINDERIINMSDIVDISLTFIKVNGQRIIAPYVIKAIGNPSYLESALTGNGGYVDEMKKIGQDVSIEKPNKVKILKYNDEIKIKYME